MQYEVSMTVHNGRIANQRKVQNGCHLKLQIRITDIEVCTDANDDASDHDV